MSLHSTQTAVMDDGRIAKITFTLIKGRGKIRILKFLCSDSGEEDDPWYPLSPSDLEREELHYVLSQLDLSELELFF